GESAGLVPVLEPDPKAIIRVLHRYRVKFLVVGALAGVLQGVPLPRTFDLDVTPASDDANKARLARALKDMDATLRLPDPTETVAIPLDERTFKGIESMTFMTRFGPFDVLFRPEGTQGYDDLATRSSTIDEG